MAGRITKVPITGLESAIKDALSEYHADVVERINTASEETARSLVAITKKTAPRGRRKRKFYRRNITYSEDKTRRSKFADKTFVWHVKAPEYRLTHLLVHGHALRNGGRTRPNPFLHNAIDEVAPEYEAKIVEAIEHGE